MEVGCGGAEGVGKTNIPAALPESLNILCPSVFIQIIIVRIQKDFETR